MKLLERGLDAYRKLRSKRGYTCDDCGREIFSYPTERLCEGCLSLLEKNDKSVCPKCGRKTLAEGVCLDCKRRVPPFARGMSAFVYGGETARLINRLKNGERFLSRFFGERMAEVWKNSGLCADAIVAVPLTAEKERERGYNQSAELAKVLSEETGIKYRNILVKLRETPPQKELSFRERAENVKGAYRAAEKKACRGLKLLLADDVTTTGATGCECAAALLAAGAQEVFFLTATSLPEKK